MIKNPLRLHQIEKWMVVMVHKEEMQVKNMVHRKKRVKNLRKNRKMRMALSLKLRQK